MKKTRVALAVSVAVLLGAAVFLVVRRDRVPTPVLGGPALPQSGGRFRGSSDDFAACGWSVHPDTGTAIEQALAAGGVASLEADITFVFYTSQHKPESVLEALRSARGAAPKVCGWSSDYGIVAPDGYHASAHGVVGLLSMRLPGSTVGTGGASLDEADSPAACAKLALRRAIENAGTKPPNAPLAMIIMSTTYDGHEETYLQALSAETGGAVPIIGGSAGGTAEHGSRDCSVIAGGRAIRNGLVLSVFYSPRPSGWAFRGGFDRTGKSGVITASEGRVIREIDGRPALDVYDEWSGGRIREAMQAGKDMNTFAALYPLCRTIKAGAVTYNLFVHAWPPADGAKSKRLVSSANLWKGDVVHFAEGSWNILINRIGVLPQQAKEGRQDMAVSAGLLVCCEAVLKNIPLDQRDQIATLINRTMGDTPWTGMFTWGEQGNFAGVGNYHGNLLTSFSLFPQSTDNATRK